MLTHHHAYLQSFLLMKTSSISLEDKKFLKKLGARIKELRLKKGWTLENTEDHGWHNWQHLQKIESGKNITIITMRKVAALYKISPSELLLGV